MEQMRFAQQLEPLAPVLDMQMAWTCYVARDFNQAEAESWKALAMEPRFAAAQHTLGLAYEQMSMYEEALVELENARAVPITTRPRWRLSVMPLPRRGGEATPSKCWANSNG